MHSTNMHSIWLYFWAYVCVRNVSEGGMDAYLIKSISVNAVYIILLEKYLEFRKLFWKIRAKYIQKVWQKRRK